MTEKITLRGHHIESLAEKYAEKKGFFRIERGKSPSELEYEKLIEKYKAEFGIEAYKKFKAEEDSKEPLMGRDYERKQEEKKRVLDAFEDKLLANPDLEILVKNGPDSVCQACPCREDCSGAIDNRDSESYKQDVTALDVYGLREHNSYTIQELTERFIEYFQKTQFPSPRTKNGFGRSKWDKIIRNSAWGED